MSSRELQLISRIINRGEIDKVVEWGIQAEDFRTGVANQMFKYLQSYYSMTQSKGSVIGPVAAAQVFPNFALCDDQHMTTDALCFEVRQNRIALECSEKLDKIREEMAINPMAACNKLSQLATEMIQLGSGKATDTMFGNAYDRILNKYQLLKAGLDTSIGKYPWSLLQQATMGLQEDDYIVIYGRPKSYKSWMLAYMAMDLFMNDKKVVIYTKEMTADNIFKRIVACLAQVPYQEFRTAKLEYNHEKALYDAHKLVTSLHGRDRIIALSGKDAPEGGDTVPWLKSKIKTYQPDVCIVDGLYLMSDVKRNKDKHAKVASISNDLRQIPLETRVPILATLQANRAAAKHNEANFDELAFSDAIGQDATLVARVINEKETPTAMLVLAGAREFSLNGFRINAVPAMNFEQYGVCDDDARITAKDIEKAKDKDTGDKEDGAGGHAKARAPAGGMVTPSQELHNVNQAIADINRPYRALYSPGR